MFAAAWVWPQVQLGLMCVLPLCGLQSLAKKPCEAAMLGFEGPVASW
jgi:hypothetical protein